MSRVTDKPYFVYILWSDSASRFYIGIKEDIAHRLQQHNRGVSRWTSKFGTWRLVHSEKYAGYSQARRREIQLKKQKNGVGFYALLGRSFEELTQSSEPDTQMV